MKRFLVIFVAIGSHCLLAGGPTIGTSWTDPSTGIDWVYLRHRDVASLGGSEIDYWTDDTAVPVTTTGEITIPSVLDGHLVTQIGFRAFENCSGLTSIIIPPSVTRIEGQAFRGCSSLTNITIPSSVTYISREVFNRCSALMQISVESDNPSYISDNGLLLSKDGKNLLAGINGDVTIPSGVMTIDNYSFSGLSRLSSVTIPEGATSIGDYAFRDCDGLARVTIPASVKSIGNSAFRYCSGMRRFYVDEKNTNYQSANGLLLSKDGKTLIAGINGEVIIPLGVATIDSYSFYDCSGLTSVTIPEGVTSIGSYAFSGCSGLTSITIPASVTNIENCAFRGCGSLKCFYVDENNSNYQSINGLLLSKDGKMLLSGINGDVTIPLGVTTVVSGSFSGYDGLTSITIPEGVRSIGSSAFSYCSGLTSLLIPSSVTSIGDSAFDGCTGLGEGIVIVDGCVLCVNGVCPSDVVLLDGTRLIAGRAFGSCGALTSITMPSSVTSIGDYAFYWCVGLTNATISTGLKSVGDNAFYHCTGLNSVALPSGLTDIGRDAFAWCTNLTSVRIPEGVTNISDNAFYNCTGLTRITIPKDVTSIGQNSFGWCTGLTNVTISTNVRSIGNSAFYHCTGLTSMILPSGMITIGDSAFIGCSGLTNVTIPSSVTSIGKNALASCTSLTSVMIPSSVASIGGGAFEYCRGLTTATIAEGVAYIGNWAFYGCVSLTNIVFGGDSPTLSGAYTFSGVHSGCNATVYEGTTGWDDDGDGKWYGLTLVYRANPIPALGETASKEEVEEALEGSADEKLTECITNATTYASYREWAETVKGTNGTSTAGAQAVKDAPTAWVSFALGSDKLLAEPPKDEDLTIETFESTDTAGKFEFVVEVDGVNVGGGAQSEAQVNQVKENLKQVLGLEGATTLESTAFSSDNIDIAFDAPVNGKVKFTAQPKTSANTFFMKVKVK